MDIQAILMNLMTYANTNRSFSDDEAKYIKIARLERLIGPKPMIDLESRLFESALDGHSGMQMHESRILRGKSAL